jgi:hypothetical protein
VWSGARFLGFIQFPWRFFLLISIAGAALTAIVLSAIPGQTGRALIALAIVVFHLHFYDRRLRPERAIPYADMNIDGTGWLARLEPGGRTFEEAAYDPAGVPRNEAAGSGVEVIAGAAEIAPISVRDADLRLNVQAPAGAARIQFNIPQFPVWQMTVDGRAVSAQRTEEGYMAVDVPAGEHVVHAQFTDTPIRRFANWLSVAAMGLMLALALAPLWRRRID